CEVAILINGVMPEDDPHLLGSELHSSLATNSGEVHLSPGDHVPAERTSRKHPLTAVTLEPDRPNVVGREVAIRVLLRRLKLLPVNPFRSKRRHEAPAELLSRD